jgi:hypothetical protein
MFGHPGGEGAPAVKRCGGRGRSIGLRDRRSRRARIAAVACCTLVLAAAQLAAVATGASAPPPRVDAVHVIAPESPEIRRLGESVAADGELLAIAAPTDGDDALEPGRVVLVCLSSNARGEFEVRPDQTLSSHARTPGDHFGASLAITGRCTEIEGVALLAVGADRATIGDDDADAMCGAVEVFERCRVGDAAWRPAARLVARTPQPAASFGAAVAFDREGWARLVVGAPRHDTAGAFDSGCVHVFRRFSSSRGADLAARWVEVATITPPAARLSMWFGSAVALEGDLLAIASPGDDVAAAGSRGPIHAAGAVYVYRRTAIAANGNERYHLERVLTAPSPESSAWFGLALALDQGVLAVGAPRARDHATGELPTGCVYLFDLEQPATAPKRIDPPHGVQTYGFGQALALRGGTLAIGAPSTDLLEQSDPEGTLDDAGAAWIYALDHAAFTAALNPPKPLQSGLFGASCAIMAVNARAATRPDEHTEVLRLAVVGHRYEEEESIAPSRGAAIYIAPAKSNGGSIAQTNAAPP